MKIITRRETIIESRAIDFIPEHERHGKILSMFTLFFSGNMQITAVALGVIPVELGLSFSWSILAIILGNILGGFVMAAHAVQGPRIGIPQMIQSRAQFGVLGGNLPLALVVLMYLGFFAGSGVLGGEAVSNIFGISIGAGILVANCLTFVLFAFGYDTIHRSAMWATSIFSLVFIFATVLAFKKFSELTSAPTSSAFSLSTFMVGISIFVAWQISYGPYVADYSRYLPRKTNASSIFWTTYCGSVIGSIWASLIGALLGAIGLTQALSNPTSAFVNLFLGHLIVIRTVTLAVIVAGVIIINAMNLYGACLSSLTILSSKASFHRVTLRYGKWFRLSLGGVGIVIGSSLAILGASNIMNYLNNLMLILVYVLIPWSAVNLTDFFLVRNGEYSVDDIYNKNGRYGSWGMPALVAFCAAVLLEVPFMNTPFFVGPIAKSMGGTDITWVIGLVVGAGLYLLMTRKLKRVH